MYENPLEGLLLELEKKSKSELKKQIAEWKKLANIARDEGDLIGWAQCLGFAKKRIEQLKALTK